MNKFSIRDVQAGKISLGKHSLSAWVKTHRRSKNVSFIKVTDGSTVRGLQLVLDPNTESYLKIAEDITTGSSITFSGELVESPGKGQTYEFQVEEIELIGRADPDQYILQKKNHSLEFLRENLHLRPRANTLRAVFRLRSNLAFAVHDFFRQKNFYHIHTPIITTADCEGAGEMFQVTVLDLAKLQQLKTIDYDLDFFKQSAYLTVSGQLEAEIFALALSNVYTFGPTFRAENSNTTRHLSEFWMIEPEMAFCDLQQDAALAYEFLQFLISSAFNSSADDIEFLHKNDNAPEGIRVNLKSVLNQEPEIIEYTDVIKILENSGKNFEFPVKWGVDLQTEHERFLTESHVQGPVIVINYPKEIKPFYMRQNDDGKTVAAMDLLVPGVGEILGGSQREEREEQLVLAMQHADLDSENYWWYRELRQYGSAPHSGFGLGFERVLMYISGMKNIRDVIPIPRYPGHGGI